MNPTLQLTMDTLNQQQLDLTAERNQLERVLSLLELALDDTQQEQMWEVLKSMTKELKTMKKCMMLILNQRGNGDDGLTENPDDYVVVYTSGTPANNNGQAGIGVWFADGDPLNVSKPVTWSGTKSAEIDACTCAIKIAQEHNINKLKIITNSKYVVDAMTKHIYEWKINNWKRANGRDIDYKTKFQNLDRLCEDVNVKWERIPLNSEVMGNEKAKIMAREGSQLPPPLLACGCVKECDEYE